MKVRLTFLGLVALVSACGTNAGVPLPDPTNVPATFLTNRPHCQAPGTYQDIVSDQTEYYRAVYEREKGIPTAGLNRYQEFLHDQWLRVVTAYQIDQALNQLSGTDLLPFPEYLQERADLSATSFGESQFDALLALSPTEQRAVFERGPDYAFCNVIKTWLWARGVAPDLVEGFAQRLAGPAVRRAYDLTPRALTGDDTFLNYVDRERQGL